MSQAGTKMRRGETGYFHWCPGCEEMHPLPDGWTFNGDVERPTFSPSFKHSWPGFESYDGDGVGQGKKRTLVCHYILTDGVLNFCADSTHALAGKAVPLPVLSEDRSPRRMGVAVRSAMLLLLCLLATPVHGGWRNLLVSLPELPGDGTYGPGQAVTVYLSTTWEARPLPHYPVWVQVGRPTPDGHILSSGWLWRTDQDGAAVLTVELLEEDLPGTWLVQAFLLRALPDGTGDGDVTSFVVQEGE